LLLVKRFEVLRVMHGELLGLALGDVAAGARVDLLHGLLLRAARRKKGDRRPCRVVLSLPS